MLLALSSVPAEAAITLTVNSTGDEGEPAASQGNGVCDWDTSTTGRQCTLRAAIQEANATPNSGGPDEIIFEIGTTVSAQTISPASALPTITEAVTIDGYTQPGARANSLAEGNDARLNVLLDGINAGTGVDGLRIEAANTTIKGLVIRRFGQDGVEISGTGATGNRIEGNFIGVNRDGITDRGNVRAGIYIESDSNTVGGTEPEMRNVISGNDIFGVHISGFSGTSGNTVAGNYIGTTAAGDADLGNGLTGIVIEGPENTIGGTSAGARNVISGNDGEGVRISGALGAASENTIQGNYIGTTASGTSSLGNDYGVVIDDDSNTVGGTAAGTRNVISGNEVNGVRISDNATGTEVQGNYIGTTAVGDAELGNLSHGMFIDGSTNTIGGRSAGARNVISGNEGAGVFIGSSASENRLEGNYVGTTADGTGGLGNESGVIIDGSSNTVGGTAAGTRNVISGNDANGVQISGNSATGNEVQGNYIGTRKGGSGDLGNLDHGVSIENAGDNTIGGRSADARNVISGNDGNGVTVSGLTATENAIEGNYIGTTADGTGNLGNTQAGVLVHNLADLTAVGGTLGGAANRIAHNGGDGVAIALSGSEGNHVLSNSIYNNDELGIDLEGGTEDANGVTANDTDDTDAGPNGLQNFPVITSATRSNATDLTTISGRLNSDPSEDYVIQCFLTNRAPASAYGEGMRLLDTELVTDFNANGNAPFSCVSAFPLLGQVPGQTVSATATNIFTGDTSEFSKNRAITTGP